MGISSSICGRSRKKRLRNQGTLPTIRMYSNVNHTFQLLEDVECLDGDVYEKGTYVKPVSYHVVPNFVFRNSRKRVEFECRMWNNAGEKETCFLWMWSNGDEGGQFVYRHQEGVLGLVRCAECMVEVEDMV